MQCHCIHCRTLHTAACQHQGLAPAELCDLRAQVFSHTNPLHGDVFPSVRRMEAEVIAMVASMLGGAVTACLQSAWSRIAVELGVLMPLLSLHTASHAAIRGRPLRMVGV